MKLSTMFHRAQKELTQTTGRPYVMDDGHCALGVILHYKYGHEKCLESLWNSNLLYNILVQDAQVLNFITGLPKVPNGETILKRIWALNDNKHWSFARFEKKARELGM